MIMKIRKVHTNLFPYMVEFEGLTIPDWYIAYNWCRDNFGEPFDQNVHDAVMDNKKWVKQWNGIRFKEEAYATWFILRFSGEYN